MNWQLKLSVEFAGSVQVLGQPLLEIGPPRDRLIVDASPFPEPLPSCTVTVGFPGAVTIDTVGATGGPNGTTEAQAAEVEQLSSLQAVTVKV